MNPPAITLDRVKYFAAGSQETPCFTARVLLDGKPLCLARNRGTGGSTMFDPLDQDYAGLRVRLAALAAIYAQIPPRKEKLPGCDEEVELQPSLELAVDDALALYLDTRDLRRKLKTHLVFTLKSKAGFFLMKQPARRPADASTVLNDLPFEEALALYRQRA